MPTSLEPQDRIIWSADVSDMVTLMARLPPESPIHVVKIDRAFAERQTLDVIDQLNERGIQVFDDAKLVEIPSKLEELARIHVAHRPAMLNCMAGSVSSGEMNGLNASELDGLRRFADVCNEAEVMPVGVTVLTSKKAQIVEQEFRRAATKQVVQYVQWLHEAGFGGVVCSPHEAIEIRRNTEFDHLELLTPGVRLPGSDSHDQARVTTPGQAVEHGATRVVCGRDLTGDPSGQNFDRILQEIIAAEAA